MTMTLATVWAGAALLMAVTASGCAPMTAAVAAAPEPPAPAVIGTTVVTPTGLGQACPVGPRALLTVRHLVERGRASDPSTYAYVVWGQAQAGADGGLARVTMLDAARDLAALEVEQDLARWYPVAEHAPTEGERVEVIGYALDRALAPKRVTARVLRVLGGLIVISSGAEPGFSGSCVWDGAGRVVGVLQWVLMRNGQPADGLASAVWGPWRDLRPDPLLAASR